MLLTNQKTIECVQFTGLQTKGTLPHREESGENIPSLPLFFDVGSFPCPTQMLPFADSLSYPNSQYLSPQRLSESPDLIAMGQWAGKIPGKPDLPDDTHLGQVIVIKKI